MQEAADLPMMWTAIDVEVYGAAQTGGEVEAELPCALTVLSTSGGEPAEAGTLPMRSPARKRVKDSISAAAGRFALYEGRQRRVEDIGASGPGRPRRLARSQADRRADCTTGVGSAWAPPSFADGQRNLSADPAGRLENVLVRVRLDPLPEVVVVGGMRQACRVAVEPIELVKAVAHQIGFGLVLLARCRRW